MNAISAIHAAHDLPAMYSQYTNLRKGVRVWSERALEEGISEVQSARYGDIAANIEGGASLSRDAIIRSVIAATGLSLDQLREVLS